MNAPKSTSTTPKDPILEVESPKSLFENKSMRISMLFISFTKRFKIYPKDLKNETAEHELQTKDNYQFKTLRLQGLMKILKGPSPKIPRKSQTSDLPQTNEARVEETVPDEELSIVRQYSARRKKLLVRTV